MGAFALHLRTHYDPIQTDSLLPGFSTATDNVQLGTLPNATDQLTTLRPRPVPTSTAQFRLHSSTQSIANMNIIGKESDLLEFTIPTISFLGMSEPLHLQFEKEYLKLAVRVIVVWCTFLLFRPRMAKAWKIMFGDNDEEKQKEIQERIAVLEAQREKSKKGGATPAGKKTYAVATAPTTSSTASPAEKGSAKRRKA